MNMFECIMKNLPSSPDKEALDKTAGYENEIFEALSKEKIDEGIFVLLKEAGFWSDGEMILCPSETSMETMYHFLEEQLNKGNKEYVIVTGYYDPFEDEEDDLVDEYTGYNYITLD